MAFAEDNSIEAIAHNHMPWEGWMWHPERESRFNSFELERFRSLVKKMKYMEKISFLILAAGTGSRLMPHTSNKPKCMVEIDGKPLIERQLAILNEFPHDLKIIVGGYKGEMLKKYGTLYFDNPDYENSNMVWSLKKAISAFEKD